MTFWWRYSKARESFNYRYSWVGSHLCDIVTELTWEHLLSKIPLDFAYRATDENSLLLQSTQLPNEDQVSRASRKTTLHRCFLLWEMVFFKIPKWRIWWQPWKMSGYYKFYTDKCIKDEEWLKKSPGRKALATDMCFSHHIPVKKFLLAYQNTHLLSFIY